MKEAAMKYTRWHLQWRKCLLLALVALSFYAVSTQAQDRRIPPIGGPGGGEFIARCPQGQLLAGVELRTGDDVDAIRPLCVTAYGPAEVGALVPGGIWFGGNTGVPRQLVCPEQYPIVTAMSLRAQGVETVIVNSISLLCGIAATSPGANATSVRFEERDLNYDYTHPGRSFAGLGILNPRADKVPEVRGSQSCADHGMVAVGIIGRSGIWLDAMGFICGEPKLTPRPGPAPGPTKLVGRVKVPPKPQVRLEDSTRPKNDSSYAFEKAVDLNALADRGEAIANADPLSSELRNQQPEGPARRGFDIGMAAAEGQTAPGPRKQKIHDSLSQSEQSGFDTAVAFSLERNRNAELAAKGATIAAADETVAAARSAEADVFFQLGFDIATGIFGNPALGALGNTATGPGSLKIRDSLSAAGQRGFNASVKLHLSRNYKP